MKHKFNLGLADLGLIVSMYGSVSSCQQATKVEEELMKDHHYAASYVLDGLKHDLGSAKSDLNYHGAYTSYTTVGKTRVANHHPAQYPDAKNSKTKLLHVARELSDFITPEQSSENPYNGIVSDLMKIQDSLPDQDDVKRYKDEPVDDSTFKPQREEINKIQEDVNKLSEENLSNVPQELITARGKRLAIFGAYLLGIFGSFGLGVYSFLNFSKKN